jgi:hypothetical protein
MIRVRALAAVAAILLASAGAGATADASTPGAPPEGAVGVRAGRDPLVPPAELYTAQDIPPIQVTLIGVDSHHPEKPLAVVRLDSRPPVRRVVRPGDRVGVYRILQIRPRVVRVSVPSLGGSTVLDLALSDSSLTR